MTQSLTVGSFLFDYLASKGVTHVFALPGDFALPTFRWLQQSKLKTITLTHEPSVGFAADGYARVNGLGVALVTYCVGGLNMLNSVACAYAEKSPMLVISGGPSPSDRKADELLHHKVRTFDTQRRIYEEVTCANTVLSNPETAAQEIIRVVEEVLAQCRPGYIEMPFDVVDMAIKRPHITKKTKPVSDPENLRTMIADAVTMINGAKRPVIIADIELHRHGLTALALKVASTFRIPIVSTLLSKSVISETHPLYIGVYSGSFSDKAVQRYVEGSDCLLMLGALITDVFLGMNTANLNRKSSILATTDRARIGYRSYENIVLREFLEKLARAPITPRTLKSLPKPAPEPQPLKTRELPAQVTVTQFFRVLGLHVGEHNTVVCDTGDALLGAMQLRTHETSNFIADAYYLSMGFAMPAAIGVMAAQPGNRVFVIIGDGAFQMTGIELSTAAKYGMKPIVFVLNNDGYGTQRHILEGPFNEILPWDYSKLVEMFGKGRAYKVKTLGALEDAIGEALLADTLVLIEVVLPRDDCSISLRRMGEALGRMRNKDKRSN
jgi:TPP-dependent 2-oxoacid decarboxylase